MKQKYFITGVHSSSSHTAMERHLASLAAAAVDCIYDRPTLEAFADYLRKQQDLLHSQRPRLTKVDISLHFKDERASYLPTSMSIGQAYVTIRDVVGEKYEGGAL